MNDNMTDLLRAMMDSGKSLETIMKEVSDAANSLQKERVRESAIRDAANRFAKSLDIEGAAFTHGICTRKMNPHDFAIVQAHFLAQNVPGYMEYLLKQNNGDLEAALAGIEQSIEATIRMHNKMIAVANSPNDVQIDTLMDTFFDEVDKAMSNKLSKTNPNGNADPIAKFLRDNGL